MADANLSRRALFAAAPAIAAAAALPAVAAQPTTEQNFRRFIDWCDLGPALDHAEAAGWKAEEIYCVLCDRPNSNRGLLFNSKTRGLATFINSGRFG